MLNKVGCGGCGGRKTKDNNVATKPMLSVSFQNMLGGMVYEVQNL